MNEDSPIPTDPHMDGAEFERLGRDLMGWIVRHLDTAEDRPVQAPAAPGEIYRGFPASPPLEGESLADLPAELDRLVHQGYRVVVGPKPGADGKRIAFLHPSDSAKVLVELCADAPS